MHIYIYILQVQSIIYICTDAYNTSIFTRPWPRAYQIMHFLFVFATVVTSVKQLLRCLDCVATIVTSVQQLLQFLLQLLFILRIIVVHCLESVRARGLSGSPWAQPSFAISLLGTPVAHSLLCPTI